MSAIRAKDTQIEMVVRGGLHARGLRFRLHDKSLPGKPDLTLRKWNTILFVNGCFWHAHLNCKYFRIPKSNREFWTGKLAKNRERDLNQQLSLTAMGWRVIVVWECSIRGRSGAEIETMLDELAALIKSRSTDADLELESRHRSIQEISAK